MCSVTHDTASEAGHIDRFLVRFFNRLISADLLRNTAVVFFSDHGMRFGPSRGANRLSWYEENMPMALLALPEPFRRSHPEMLDTLRANTNRLTTPFDLHETVRRLSYVNQPYDDSARRAGGRRGVSLLDVKLGDRTCENASIAPTYCECLLSSTTAVSLDNGEVCKLFVCCADSLRIICLFLVFDKQNITVCIGSSKSPVCSP